MAFQRIAMKILYSLLKNQYWIAARKMGIPKCLFSSLPFSYPLQHNHSYPSITKCPPQDRASQAIICDLDGALLKPISPFPFFMLVAFEAGSLLRAFLLLISYPLQWVLDCQSGLRVLIFITFSGMGLKRVESIGRAVLPKFFLQNVNGHVHEVLASTGKKIVVTTLPRIMVESFLKEYLSVDITIGTELYSFGGFFLGLVREKTPDLKLEGELDVGVGSPISVHQNPLIYGSKEVYIANVYSTLPREKYRKPLVFHDGRLAFLPTPEATLFMFLWLPFGVTLAFIRLVTGILLPPRISLFLGSLTGIDLKLHQFPPTQRSSKHVLYVCTHRTLLDPVFLSTLLGKPLTAVTYSLSRISEFISPIKTVRLTREREKDAEQMSKLLGLGDLVVCPEGTTCREPYLLRFSSLFAELSSEIVPVAIDTRVEMFYGTTASGLKCLDPVFFFMNPRPGCHVYVLEKVPFERTCSAGKSSFEVANEIQKKLADVLGFECTTLTRRDKYMMLAGHEGVVSDRRGRRS